MEVSGGCVAACFVNPQNVYQTVTASASGWNGDGKRSLFRATALIRPGVVIVARTCKSKYVLTSHFLFA